ncbi:uncharacterized protein FOMMEDRAFT_148530 [Fomitiporia mediterranea MF3/22]|uniref:uncharacterized protein n=1 Tax=Fomitiporia mediterranea (strain MF3/22) TaxID=694068 RepID=UPI0004408F0A|nr:uncharacterized protein FOMMEDRAFT_148530 [Fomitiporia mediterranea MF3/22]EJC99594.1 hypothetical protein FOMMEDRAFT_148530 [Fomitiporia mediterranea MF3/22]
MVAPSTSSGIPNQIAGATGGAGVNTAGPAVDISSQPYAKRVQALIKLITDLRALGAQADVDLPRIAVIGNQSAGKSSLVEAMTKITVPRSQGTCTRCPMECRLSNSSEPFKCQISLRIEEDEFGMRVDKVKETKFGTVLHDKSQLEVMLRRAQLAILNPSVSKEKFVDLNIEALDPDEPPLDSTRQLQFSANVVCLDISSPDVTNLSFIDLPGIISNVADGEDPRSIDLIQNLVRDNISGNALILLAITMRDDIQNQKAALLAKEADPNGERTIGVLTKPDTLQNGEYDQWLDVLTGRKHQLTHGYYVTKQASPLELQERPTYEEGRERERTFFATQSPWRDQAPRVRERLGVPNLTMRLSTLLSQLIEKTIPKLKIDSRSSLNLTLKELNNLPPPPSADPTSELLKLVVEFNSNLHSHVRGLSGDIIQRIRPAYESFMKDTLSTKPNFVPFLEIEQTKDTFDCLSPSKTTSPVLSKAASNAKSNSSKNASTSATYKSGLPSEPTTQDDSEFDVDSVQEAVYLDDVRNRIHDSKSRELPFNVPYKVKVGYITECVTDWKFHARTCFEKVFHVYQEYLEHLVSKQFGGYSSGGLHERVRSIVEDELERTKAITLARIDWLLELEEDPFTLNEHYLSSCRDKYLKQYYEQRQAEKGNSSADSEQIQSILAGLARIGKHCRAEDLARLNGPDEYEQELEMMAEVTAYFRVAYKRIIDNLPRVIDVDFLKGLQKCMHEALIRGLRMSEEDSKETAGRLLSEDPNITLRRAGLEQVKERLEGICTKLSNFAMLGQY